jgi:threonine dehydratase
VDLPTLAELEIAVRLIQPYVPPTPQYAWPLLGEHAGCEVWVKHENHTPIGSFKLRGGLVYLHDFKEKYPNSPGVIAATRGNHGQSVAFAARTFGVRARIVVPEGNSREKNAAMRAWGGELIVHGHDFQAAFEHAHHLADTEGWHFFPSFHRMLVQGVGTGPLEFLRNVSGLDALYVPIGLGSSICGALAARAALNRKMPIVGVVAANAPCYALSFTAGKPITTQRADTIADGLACRVPDADALAVIRAGVERVVVVSEAEIEEAMRLYFSAAHQIAEGAAAAGVAALLKDRTRMNGKKVGLMLTGSNVDREVYQRILQTGGP